MILDELNDLTCITETLLHEIGKGVFARDVPTSFPDTAEPEILWPGGWRCHDLKQDPFTHQAESGAIIILNASFGRWQTKARCDFCKCPGPLAA